MEVFATQRLHTSMDSSHCLIPCPCEAYLQNRIVKDGVCFRPSLAVLSMTNSPGRAEAMVDDDVLLFLYLLFSHQGSTFIGKGVLT